MNRRIPLLLGILAALWLTGCDKLIGTFPRDSANDRAATSSGQIVQRVHKAFSAGVTTAQGILPLGGTRLTLCNLAEAASTARGSKNAFNDEPWEYVDWENKIYYRGVKSYNDQGTSTLADDVFHYEGLVFFLHFSDTDTFGISVTRAQWWQVDIDGFRNETRNQPDYYQWMTASSETVAGDAFALITYDDMFSRTGREGGERFVVTEQETTYGWYAFASDRTPFIGSVVKDGSGMFSLLEDYGLDLDGDDQVTSSQERDAGQGWMETYYGSASQYNQDLWSDGTAPNKVYVVWDADGDGLAFADDNADGKFGDGFDMTAGYSMQPTGDQEYYSAWAGDGADNDDVMTQISQVTLGKARPSASGGFAIRDVWSRGGSSVEASREQVRSIFAAERPTAGAMMELGRERLRELNK